MFKRGCIQTLRLVAVVAFVLLIWLQVTALADTGVVDPNADPVGAVGQISALWHTGGITITVIVAAFFVLKYLKAHVDALNKGRVAAVLAAIIGGAATIVGAAVNGTTPNLSMIVAGLGTAIALYVSPHGAPPDSTGAASS